MEKNLSLELETTIQGVADDGILSMELSTAVQRCIELRTNNEILVQLSCLKW